MIEYHQQCQCEIYQTCEVCKPTPQTPTPETKVNVQATPTLKYLRHYLDYQYPASRGDIQLNKICNQIAELERERDEAREKHLTLSELFQDLQKRHKEAKSELTQLRKVCDDWHITAMTIMESSNDIHAACERLKPLMKQHSTLPHVIKAKETKPDDMYESLTSDEEFNGH